MRGRKPVRRRFRWTAAATATAVGAAVQAAAAVAGDQVDEAIERGLDYLAKQQNRDGAITDTGHPHAMTALALLAASAAGHTASDPSPRGAMIRNGLGYLLGQGRQRDNGYFGGDGSRMYGHGIVTLALAELLGMGGNDETDARIRQRLEKAIQLILWAQDRKDANNAHEFGGWRYEPDARDSDLSVTIWQLMSLRAARNAGLDVPKAAIEKAVQYLRRTYRDDLRGRNRVGGGCAYQPGREPTYTSASYGLLAMQVCGLYDAPEVQGAAEFLMTQKIHWDNRYFLYGTYYYAQGMYQRGGEYAEHARREVEAALLPRQQEDGSWRAAHGEEHNAGKVYGTSMAILSLAVKYHYLPIYQR